MYTSKRVWEKVLFDIYFKRRRLFLSRAQDPASFVLPARSEWSRQTWIFPQKEKCLTGLHQSQNSGKVALEFCLTDEIWSDIWTQRRGLNEIRLTLANWCGVLVVNAFKIYSSKLNQEEIWAYKKTYNNKHHQSSRSGMPGPCQITFTDMIIYPVEVKNRHPIDSCVYCCWPKTGCW